MAQFRVLVVPLDWGLGHATRCVPVIRELLRQGAEVILGGSGGSLAVLQQEFPDLSTLPFPAYGVRYSKSSFQVPGLLQQLPRLLRVIRAEHDLLETAIRSHQIEAVISDNRYGLWSRKLPTVFICHQLRIQLPRLFSLWESQLAWLHQQFIDRFSQCWIPDFPGPDNLSGRLTELPADPSEMQFVGALSRFEKMAPIEDRFSNPLLGDQLPTIAAVLSGPEPQRTMLEDIIVAQSQKREASIWIIQGKAGSQQVIWEGNVTRIGFMGTEDLHRLYTQVPILISRPGYSSLMDFAQLGLQKMILIPTPGQTEQEYLATRLERQQVAPMFRQADFQLGAAIGRLGEYSGFEKELPSGDFLLEKAVSKLLEMV